jgi:hypothetical protein
MPEPKSHRGRPKGSGIDDAMRLRAIAELIDTNPDMKPTTAIRAIGVSDPSTIRRLRDKFNEQRNSTASLDTPAANAILATTSEQSQPAARVVAASCPADDRMTAPVKAGVPEDAKCLQTGGWLTSWFGVGVALATSAAEFQMTVLDQMLRMPQLAWNLPSAGVSDSAARPILLH